MKKYIKYSLLSLSVFALSYCLFTCTKIYKNQEHILFRSVPLSHDHQFESRHDFDEIFLEGKDKGLIHALHYKSKTKAKGLVLYYHGRGSNLAGYWSKFTDDFVDRGYDLMIMDYRTFGKSRGKLTQHHLLSDAEKVYLHALTQYDPSSIILYGRSLGTGIATYVASKHKAKMLILEAPYTSILDLAPSKLPFIPKFFVNLIVKYPLQTYEWIQSVRLPIHIFHGKKDQLIPYHNSVRLHELAHDKTCVDLITIDDGAHDTLKEHSEYQKHLDFLLK